MQVRISKFFGLDIFADAHDAIVRIDEAEIAWHFLPANDTNFLAKAFQKPGHPKAASQSVTVRTNVAGEDHVVGRVDDFAESWPVNLHFIFFLSLLTGNFLEPISFMGFKDLSCGSDVFIELCFEFFS